jgi:hypothetical protein
VPWIQYSSRIVIQDIVHNHCAYTPCLMLSQPCDPLVSRATIRSSMVFRGVDRSPPSRLLSSTPAGGFALSVPRHRSSIFPHSRNISCGSLLDSLSRRSYASSGRSIASHFSWHIIATSVTLQHPSMAPSSVASDDSANDVGADTLHLAFKRLTQDPQDSFIVDIDAIQAHGIGAVDIAKLKANGYYTIASVHSATRRNLLKIKGFSEIKVDKVKDAITKCQVWLPQSPIVDSR